MTVLNADSSDSFKTSHKKRISSSHVLSSTSSHSLRLIHPSPAKSLKGSSEITCFPPKRKLHYCTYTPQQLGQHYFQIILAHKICYCPILYQTLTHSENPKACCLSMITAELIILFWTITTEMTQPVSTFIYLVPLLLGQVQMLNAIYYYIPQPHGTNTQKQ
jgi:hypothetical protein